MKKILFIICNIIFSFNIAYSQINAQYSEFAKWNHENDSKPGEIQYSELNNNSEYPYLTIRSKDGTKRRPIIDPLALRKNSEVGNIEYILGKDYNININADASFVISDTNMVISFTYKKKPGGLNLIEFRPINKNKADSKHITNLIIKDYSINPTNVFLKLKNFNSSFAILLSKDGTWMPGEKVKIVISLIDLKVMGMNYNQNIYTKEILSKGHKDFAYIDNIGETSLGTLREWVTNRYDSVKISSEKINSFDQRITDVTAKANKVDALETKVNEVETKVNKVDGLETKVTAVETKSTELNTKVDGFDQRITDAETKANKVDGLEAKVRTLDDTVNNKLDTIISDKVGDIVVSDEAINKAVGNKMNSFQQDIDKINDIVYPKNNNYKYSISLIPNSNSKGFSSNIVEIPYYDAIIKIDYSNENKNSIINYKIIVNNAKEKYSSTTYGIKNIKIINDLYKSIKYINKDIIYTTGIEGKALLEIELVNLDKFFTAISIPGYKIMDVAYAEKPNSYRQKIQKNIISKYKIVNLRDTTPFSRCRVSAFGNYTTNYFPRQIHLFGNNGENPLPTYNDKGQINYINAINHANTNFFWPELADNLRFASVEKSTGNYWGQGIYAKFMISPHYYICAKHCFWPWCTGSSFCVNRKNQKFIGLSWNASLADPLTTNSWGAGNSPVVYNNSTRFGSAYGDLAIWKFNSNVAFPSNLVMKFCSKDILESTFRSFFKKSIVMHTTSHNTVVPNVLSEFPSDKFGDLTNYPKLTLEEKNMLNALQHPLHKGDSSRLTFIPLPDGQVIPLSIFKYANGEGSTLIEPEVITWIKDFVEKDSGGKETIQMWTKEEIENIFKNN